MNIFHFVCFVVFSAASCFADQFSSAELTRYSHELKNYPTYTYPYPELSEKLATEGKSSLPLFIYGSLIDEKSAARTLSTKAIATRRPALAFGMKRVFNRDVPINPESSFGLPCNANARGMLNVAKTEHLENFMNGVILDIPLDEIPALMKRETGYNLVPVVVADWNALNIGKIRYSIAYILQAPSGSAYVNANILPRPGYYELARDAAKQYGPFYEMLWYNSTFMADGKTPVIMWERNLHQKDAKICETQH